MRTTTKLLARLAFAFCLFASVPQPSKAQDSSPYTEGSVWFISFIKLKTGLEDDYLKSLKTSWQAMADEGKKVGYILSSKILYGEAANPQDFQLILMVELKNMAALDDLRAKEDAALQKVFGSSFEQASKDLAAKRVEMREIYGTKILREITLK
ncbi:MAG TPA: hypothetical protein VK673_03900 [Chthoniobacterales bacterium]|nr:hypothetical protein [Chthoniobacterales bacterium]